MLGWVFPFRCDLLFYCSLRCPRAWRTSAQHRERPTTQMMMTTTMVMMMMMIIIIIQSEISLLTLPQAHRGGGPSLNLLCFAIEITC